MRSIIVSMLTLCIVFAATSNSFCQNFSGKFMLGIYENAVVKHGKAPKHDYLSLSAAFVNGKGNHNELSLNSLKMGNQKFSIGVGFQHKWVFIKKLPINPYLGFYNDIKFDGENILSDEQVSDYTISLKTGVAPGIHANIGRFFVDGSVRLELSDLAYEKTQNIDLTILNNFSSNSFGFKEKLGVRVGAGFRF
ncbi:MAG: hypothetical protein HKN92_08850 [Chitinophagales bacterium]|nr:hypothetical protein [Chitinophagales bacterium]